MRLYAEDRPKAIRQGIGDALLLVWIVVWARIGLHLTDLVDRLGGPGRTIASAGTQLEGGLEGAAGGAGRVPVVGGALEGVFGDAAGAGETLRDAGTTQAEVAHQVAVALGLAVAGLAIAVALIRYLPGRLQWIRDARSASALLVGANDLRVFAIRAVANRPLHELRRVSPDPGADLAAGRFDRLAALELAELGLRPGRSLTGDDSSPAGVHLP